MSKFSSHLHDAKRTERERAVRRLGLVVLGLVVTVGCHGKTIEFDSNVPAIAAIVSGEVNLDAGVNGKLEEVMSTAFQSAAWQSGFFVAHPDERNPDTSAVVALAPQHALVQVYDSPLKGGTAEGAYWDFTELDAVVQPLLRMGTDPLMQIVITKNTPLWLDPSTHPVQNFERYCAGIVSYYNADGVIQRDGGLARSNAGKPIKWWAILNDPNTGSAYTGAMYAAVYNAAVSKMWAVDHGIKFVAPEFNDCIDKPNGFPSPVCGGLVSFVSDFLAATTNGGADGGPTQIDVLSLHMFSTNIAVAQEAGVPLESDSVAFQTVIPKFASDVSTLRQPLVDAGRSSVPIWVTENQVNSDVPSPDGLSENWTTSVSAGASPVPFQADRRGTEGFFTAWRPYLFSQLGKAGASALFQWQYTAGRCPSADAGCSLLSASDTDRQNAEVDYFSGNKYLSYWVDSTLARKFPPGQDILKVAVDLPDASDSNVELLATRRVKGDREVVVVMVVNASVQKQDDINGPGAPCTVIVDLTQLLEAASVRSDAGVSSWSASALTIDQTTDLDAGPTEVSVALRNRWVPIVFKGYGVTFLTLSR